MPTRNSASCSAPSPTKFWAVVAGRWASSIDRPRLGCGLSLIAADSFEPSGVGCRPRQVAIEVRRAITPPDRAALTERVLGLVDDGATSRLRICVPDTAGVAHGAPRRHQLIDQRLASLGVQAGIRRPPEPATDDQIATVGCQQGQYQRRAIERRPGRDGGAMSAGRAARRMG